jgi:hypothetical protein
MLNHTPVEDCLEVKEYLDEMIEYYKHTSSPVLAERRKTYKDIKIALFGEDLDNGNTGDKDTPIWFC